MYFDEEIARTQVKPFDVAVARIQEVERLAGNQLETRLLANVAAPRERIVPLRAERLELLLLEKKSD